LQQIPDTTDPVEEVPPESEEYHKGWFHFVKLGILILKVVIVSYISFKAIQLRNNHYAKIELVQFLLLGNVAILIGVLIFDLTA
jgi:hypothetical protein